MEGMAANSLPCVCVCVCVCVGVGARARVREHEAWCLIPMRDTFE